MKKDLFEALLQTWKFFSSPGNEDGLIERAVQTSRILTDAMHGSMTVFEGDKLQFVFSTTSNFEKLKSFALRIGEGIPGEVAQSLKPRRIEYPQEKAPAPETTPPKPDTAIKSMLCVPMVFENRLFGTMQVFNKESEPGFSSEDEVKMQIFANETARAIENFRQKGREHQEIKKAQEVFVELADGIQTKNDFFEIVMSAWQTLSSETDIDHLIEQVAKISMTLTGASNASMTVAEGIRLRFVFSTSQDPEKIKKFRIKFGEGLPGKVAQTGEPLRQVFYSGVLPLHEGEPDKDLSVKSILCVPMIVRHKVFGTIQVFNKKDGPEFTPQDESRLQLFANQSAMAIEHFHLQEKILQSSRRVQSIFEALTDGIMVVDPEGMPIIYNKAIEALFFPEGKQNYALTTYLSNLVKNTGKSSGSAEVFLMKPHNLILSNRFVVVKDSHGKNQEIVVSLRNITDQSALDRRFSQFYAIMLRYSSRITQTALREKDPKKVKRLLIKQNSVLRNLVFLTELKSGPLRIEKDNCDILELYGKVRNRMAKELSRKGISISDSPVTTLGPKMVRLETRRFAHIFQILFQKGLQTLPKKEGEMRIKATIETGKIIFEFAFLGKNVETMINEVSLDWNAQINRIISGEGKALDLDLAFMGHLVRAHKGNTSIVSDQPHRAVIRFDLFLD